MANDPQPSVSFSALKNL